MAKLGSHGEENDAAGSLSLNFYREEAAAISTGVGISSTSKIETSINSEKWGGLCRIEATQ